MATREGGQRVCACLRLRGGGCWKARRGLHCCVTDSELSEEIRRYIVGLVAHFHLRAAPPAVRGRCFAGEGELKPAAQGLQLPCSLCFTNDPKCRCHVTDALQAHQVLIVRRKLSALVKRFMRVSMLAVILSFWSQVINDVLSIHKLSFCLSTWLSISLSNTFLINLSIFLCPFLCLSFYLSFCPSTWLSISLIHLSI